MGLILAFICFTVLSYGLFYLGLILILINRFLDGLDGRLARLGKPRKFGAFFDITSDFAFYALIPLGFAVFSPDENALPTACFDNGCMNKDKNHANPMIFIKDRQSKSYGITTLEERMRPCWSGTSRA